jgi:hypothetical protein
VWEHVQTSPDRCLVNIVRNLTFRSTPYKRKHPDRNADDAWKSRAWEHAQTFPGRLFINIGRKPRVKVSTRHGKAVGKTPQSKVHSTSIVNLAFTSTPYQQFESLEIKSIPCVGARCTPISSVVSYSTRSSILTFWVWSTVLQTTVGKNSPRSMVHQRRSSTTRAGTSRRSTAVGKITSVEFLKISVVNHFIGHMQQMPRSASVTGRYYV